MSLILGAACNKPNTLLDDAGGKTTKDFPQITEDVFKPMDGGITLTPDEIKGRNAWIIWTAGNEQFWNRMVQRSYGLIDLLKTLDNRYVKRGQRFKELGLVNEPGLRAPSKPDEFGLWLDECIEPARPGVDEKVYGRSSGVIGFRLFPNPEFDQKSRQTWDPNRFISDPSYYCDPELVRPYRVGVTCAACHVMMHPLFPADDPENPQWENLASLIGNQYIDEGRVFAPNAKKGGFFAEMIKVQPRGTSDTSRIATDNINNPSSINAIFSINARLAIAHEERMSGGTLRLPTQQDVMLVPRLLKDGADCVGLSGAIQRVYVNIGMHHQHWLQQHNPFVGLEAQQPFDVAMAQRYSVYWRATEERAPLIAAFFKRIEPMPLTNAPGGAAYITNNLAVLKRGSILFGENCAGCHSSKRPAASMKLGSIEARQWFQDSAKDRHFLEDNFLSDEERHSVHDIETNAGRASATNAKRGHIWDHFSSETYKTLAPVAEIEVYNPYGDTNEKFKIADGGPGYYRTPSLISLWATAPFFHNNALGKFTGDPSVKGRMEAFHDAVDKLLWPEKRLGTNSIWRTTQESWLEIHQSALPAFLKSAITKDTLRLGPIPQGTPVNLLANVNPDADQTALRKLYFKVKNVLHEIEEKKLDAGAARDLMRRDLAPDLFDLSKCPDLIEDKGHYFGACLNPENKRALIEFLKTL